VLSRLIAPAGERGINLSGGQKARVALGRAMYTADTRLLLLDDPLSAVDSHVGEHLFSQAIAGEISEGKTRILVTHHVHVLSRCDRVIVMDHGTIKCQGTYQELLDQGVDFAGAVDVSKMQKIEEEEAEGETTDDKAETVEKTKKSERGEDKVAQKKAGATLVKDEEREEGEVSSNVYIRYARSGGLCIAMIVLVIQGLGRTAEIMSSFWLARWADRMQYAASIGEPFSDQETSFYVGIYGVFGLLAVLSLSVRGIFLARHRLKASQQLHDGLSDSVLRAPVAFFDVTPIGRILNRFAADMDKVDLELTQTLSQGVTTIFQLLGALVAILVATKGTFFIPLIPLGYLYFLVQKWFRKSSTELQRVTSVANSPIFADFSQTLSGTSTIRAYGVQNGFFDHCKSSFDNMNASYILVQLASYWLALRLDVMGGLIAVFVGAVAVGTLESGFIPAGWLGLALSYSIEVTTYLKFGVQMLARLEADMSSVERIQFYTDKIEPEAPDEIPDKDPKPGTWPTSGEIDLSHASMRYRDGPLVLKDLTLKVNGGEKIGVCGRTGSGKSSLMIALFRISELEKDGGCVTIDGINTGEIGLETLRLNLSIIPQDPVMFSNTVRYNLDPFGAASDEELWEVLKKVQMGEAIAALPKGLDEEVAEGGENFSQGQRQLLCIARSVLRKPKILVMDEATASIDNETDAIIQRMIREHFHDATVLTIAHRLGTIADCDRILVLDDGRIAELDTPENLMSKEDGLFRAMVEKSRATHGNVIDED
jgi:ABC-type multidrug transport system fused ATPase/permease subunit